MARILLVDDSRTARLALRRILERSTVGLEVVGAAADAREALRLAEETAPDLVAMDVHLGPDDGVQLGREILERFRTRIAIVTSVRPTDPELLFRALAAGALDVLAKPSGAPTKAGEAEEARFVRALRALAEVPLLRGTLPRSRWRPDPRPTPVTLTAPRLGSEAPRPRVASETPPPGPVDRVLVGVSTGGPPLLEQILRSVPTPLGAPLVVVQHIAPGFGRGFARWLATATKHEVRYCDAATALAPGAVHVAADDTHLGFLAANVVGPWQTKARRFATPSVDELFLSALPFDPSRTLAMLLTGMGSDGAEGLAALRGAGATTVAQEPSTCVVGSMPRSAIGRGAATHVLDPEQIAAVLTKLRSR